MIDPYIAFCMVMTITGIRQQPINEVLKLEMLRGWLARNPGMEVAFIVDDRQRVVDMWWLAVFFAASGGAVIGFIAGERFGYDRGYKVCRNGEWN